MSAGRIVVVCALIAGFGSCYGGKIPDYIHICKRTDPDVNKCIRSSVEVLRPRLRDGIPELNVPAIEPLHLDYVNLTHTGNFFLVLKNIALTGVSDFEITKLKADIPNATFKIGIKIPTLFMVGDYDMNARLVGVPIKGQGTFSANATNCDGNAVLRAHLEDRDGKQYMKFDGLDLNLDIEDYGVMLKNLFNGDPILTDAANNVLNDPENRAEFVKLATPHIEEKASEVLLEIAQKIVENFTYDEVFPE